VAARHGGDSATLTNVESKDKKAGAMNGGEAAAEEREGDPDLKP
jgi:hypothetical protein